MKQNTVKTRISLYLTGLGLLFFLLSFGIYTLVRPLSPFFALVAASFIFSLCMLVATFIITAQELWLLKKLIGGKKDGQDWTDLPEASPLPVELEEVRGVLTALKQKMDEAITSQRRFLADASHEMRSPITIMRGDIEITLRRERDSEEYKRVLSSNLEEIDRLEYLIKDLMFLARTDANELLMNMGPVRLDEVLIPVYGGLKPMSRRKEVNLGIMISDEDEYVIQGDADRLKQLFVNLVENALRYTPAGGHVEIRLSKVTGVSKVSIADNGIGIPKKEIGKIFERFYRVDKARARESGGTGLGLCICKWIVESHSGEILIDSEEGVGTTVTVMFI